MKKKKRSVMCSHSIFPHFFSDIKRRPIWTPCRECSFSISYSIKHIFYFSAPTVSSLAFRDQRKYISHTHTSRWWWKSFPIREEKAQKRSQFSYRKYFDTLSRGKFNSRLESFLLARKIAIETHFFFLSFFHVFQMHPFA